MLGHTVWAIQENTATADDILRLAHQVDLLIYSHTHGWDIPGLDKVLSYYKKVGVPTASVHLDRWAWLEREKDIGEEPTWKTEFQFMADGSPEAVELYKKHNLKWFYLKPGVIARDCYMANPDPVRFPHEIVFVGSKVYHPEYPFRVELLEWLHKTYGERFGHYGNDGKEWLRGHDLNVLYATAKIVVGDSCFGGRPNYVSDRYYETRGRGGLLLHPYTEGVDVEGVITYLAGNLEALEMAINQTLRDTDEYREDTRISGFNWVKNHETYTDRAAEIIEKITENT